MPNVFQSELNKRVDEKVDYHKLEETLKGLTKLRSHVGKMEKRDLIWCDSIYNKLIKYNRLSFKQYNITASIINKYL